MADTKRGRDKQAQDEEERQRERALEQELERGDEDEPAADSEQGAVALETADPPTCHRRDCNEPAAFRVLERYEEETGHGTVAAVAALCHDHTAEEGPANLDDATPDYVFRIDPITEPDAADGE
ncbi:hypothetical protein C479_07968 [Halovivax asiaticus JCM 14624]|uniref:Uncharacterized protein n=1 Tax=Halovivax asiaticus JCM 14624 TaxID=1227490 RepID=M0BIL5_9EURY|nr:hypothetical protein [Halovivax asiaticus]ELZ10731.1 hypothetical protein C479_07968 [Halovivax asiaticus JCM 14624]